MRISDWSSDVCSSDLKQMVYGWVTACQDDRSDGVIRNFADKETERLFATGMTRKLPQSIVRRALARLAYLNMAASPDDLREPLSNRLEALSGDRAGQWRIRRSDERRVGKECVSPGRSRRSSSH